MGYLSITISMAGPGQWQRGWSLGRTTRVARYNPQSAGGFKLL